MSVELRESQEYDYIICGGGTAGCVIARRLAENSTKTILLVEAGKRKEDIPASAIPAAVSQILGTDADWNIQSEPCAELNNRRLHLGRGKFISGSSGCNGTLCIRGVPQDYDDWGVEGWSGTQMFEDMKRVEDFRNKDWFEPAQGQHGVGGPVLTAPHDPAPISSRVLESFQSKGLPLKPDMFTTGDSSEGCGHAIRSIYKGVRSSAADYIGGEAKDLTNVEVATGYHVDTVLVEARGNEHVATGIVALNSKGEKIRLAAREEVIISSGTYGSPAVLLRSGIGPRTELNALGISTKIDLPGVGKNLMDHLVVLNFYEVSEPNLTNDHLIWHTGAKEKTGLQYKTSRTGFLSQFPFGVFAYARLDDRLKGHKLWEESRGASDRDGMGTLSNQPHIEIWNTECYSPKYMFKDFPPDGKYAFAMATTFFSARSRGEVTLASLDPTQNPSVQHNFLNDPLDMLVFSEGCRLANEIALEGSGTKDIVSGSWPTAQGHDKYAAREDWEKAIRERADTCYHPAGTCKMGDSSDRMAVVDSQLCVHGVKNLRVVDASIMPLLPSGHPQMAVFAIAERAADLIKANSAT